MENQPHHPIRWRTNHITPLDGEPTTSPHQRWNNHIIPSAYLRGDPPPPTKPPKNGTYCCTHQMELTTIEKEPLDWVGTITYSAWHCCHVTKYSVILLKESGIFCLRIKSFEVLLSKLDYSKVEKKQWENVVFTEIMANFFIKYRNCFEKIWLNERVSKGPGNQPKLSDRAANINAICSTV